MSRVFLHLLTYVLLSFKHNFDKLQLCVDLTIDFLNTSATMGEITVTHFFYFPSRKLVILKSSDAD
jgi:hypothetical protein